MTAAAEFLIIFFLFLCIWSQVAKWRLTELTNNPNKNKEQQLEKAADRHWNNKKKKKNKKEKERT